MTVESPPARILVVDDDASSRDIAARLLAREGYDTRTAADGPECLTLVTRERVDLILLDVSVKTVETHRAQLMERLDIHDVAGLVRYAIRTGVVTADD